MPKTVEYRLDYTTGEITSSEGLGVLHSIYKNMRVFFLEDGGVQAMAELLRDGKIGDEMRFDADEEMYRIYVPSTGLWRLAKQDDATTVASEFLKRLLGPIKHLAEFVGIYTFDWLRGTYAPVVDDDRGDEDVDSGDEDVDSGGEDVDSGGKDNGGESGGIGSKRPGTTRGKQARKKKKVSTPQWTGPRSMQTLKDTIFKFVETPKHTAEVLKPLQYRLTAPFLEKSVPHLLPCPNGVIDLRTGALLPKAAPRDFFTMACATEYNPEADIGPAREFFDNFFPPDAYDDQEALVCCLQQWFGYCLTLETRLEVCVWFYGEGSNGKSKMTELMAAVLGDSIHADILMASLCKGRGVNNDALHDARHARHVTISESDKSTKISEAAFRSLVSGEKQHLKTMWKKEAKCTVNMKMSFAVNTLPQWDDSSAYCTTRRNIYIMMKKVYIDMESAAGKKLADEYRAKGTPQSLIAQKDVKYFDNKVKGKESAFLRFMVLGAMEYYKNGIIQIPPSLNAHQRMELSDKVGAVEEYVEDYLEIVDGNKMLQQDILTHFRTTTEIEEISFKPRDFFSALEKAIKDKGPDWMSAIRYNGRTPTGGKGMLWKNVGFVDRAGQTQSSMQSATVNPGWVVTHDMFVPFHDVQMTEP